MINARRKQNGNLIYKLVHRNGWVANTSGDKPDTLILPKLKLQYLLDTDVSKTCTKMFNSASFTVTLRCSKTKYYNISMPFSCTANNTRLTASFSSKPGKAGSKNVKLFWF